MAKKGVYHHQYLAVYISQDDFDELVRNKSIGVPVYIGKEAKEVGGLRIRLDFLAQTSLGYAKMHEKEAVEKVRREFKKQHPNYKTYAERQGRKKHGKG